MPYEIFLPEGICLEFRDESDKTIFLNTEHKNIVSLIIDSLLNSIVFLILPRKPLCLYA